MIILPNSTKKKVATAMNERIIKGTSSNRTDHRCHAYSPSYHNFK